MSTSELENHGLSRPSPFAGGRLSLDLVNTWCLRRGEPLEFLDNALELWNWLRAAEVEYGLSLLDEPAEWDGALGAAMLARALELRRVLDVLMRGVIAGHPTDPVALEQLNDILRSTPSYPQLVQGETALSVSTFTIPSGEGWLRTIALDAVDLLCDGDLSLLKCCEGRTCIRVFYDTTKNHKRRWCVEKCSSQTKAAAYYQRKKARLAGE